MTSLTGIDAALYEAINLAIWLLCLGVVAVFVRYLLTEFADRKITFSSIMHRPMMMRHQMAIGIVGVTFGDFGIRLWTWYANFAERTGVNVNWMGGLPFGLLPVFSALIEIAGLLCVIRVFSPDEWGNKAWLFIALGVILLQIL